MQPKRDKQPQKPARTLTCPNCGAAIPIEKYAMLIEVEVDGVRDVCPTCKQIVMLDLTPFHGTLNK